jgi:hypothetical protein
MPRAAIPEFLLGCLTTPDRAAAIMGDLTEMAEARGSVWFWTAYARTLGRLCWRPSTAFVVGYLSFLVAGVTFQRPWAGPGARVQPHLIAMLQHGSVPLLALLPFPIERLIFPVAGPLIVGITVPLRFVFPYAAVRYGLLDPFVQLAGAAFLTATLVLVYPPALSPLLAIALLLGFGAALTLRRWRSPAIVLASTLAIGFLAILSVFGVVALGSAYVAEPRILPKSEFPSATVSLIALIVPAIVCSWLHRRLPCQDLAGGVHV